MGLNIYNANTDCARVEAAMIVSDTLPKQRGDPGLSPAAIAQLLVPPYGVAWIRHVLSIVTTVRIDKLMRRMRNLHLIQSDYERLSAFSQRPIRLPPRFRVNSWSGRPYPSVSG